MSEQPKTTGRQRAYEEFMDPGPLPAGADLPAAEARLLAALEREIGVPLAPQPGPEVAHAARPAKSDAPRRPGSLFAWLTGPRRSLAFAVVVIVAAVGVWSQVGPRREGEAPLLRGPAVPEAPGGWSAALAATPLGDGRTRLAWAPAPQATGYAVVFLDDDLHEIARIGDLETTTLVLDRAALPAGLRSGQTLLWRVAAYSGGDEIARSTTSPVSVP